MDVALWCSPVVDGVLGEGPRPSPAGTERRRRGKTRTPTPVVEVLDAAQVPSPISWPLVGVVGAISLLTMPLTAMWFLMLGWLSFVAAAMGAALARLPYRSARVLSVGGSVGIGLLFGPAVYLSLASSS